MLQCMSLQLAHRDIYCGAKGGAVSQCPTDNQFDLSRRMVVLKKTLKEVLKLNRNYLRHSVSRIKLQITERINSTLWRVLWPH